MKYVVVIPDGAADRPAESLDGRTALEAANTPTLDLLAREGRVGLAAGVLDGGGEEIGVREELEWQIRGAICDLAPAGAARSGGDPNV